MFYSCQVTTRPSRTPSDRVASEVLSAALEILNEGDADGFTVRAIALRANVAPMAIYNHFDGLNGVLDALWKDGFTELRETLSIATGNPSDDLNRAGIAYRTFAMNNRGLYTVMFLHRFRPVFHPSSEGQAIAIEAFAKVVALVERCQAVGAFRDGDPAGGAQVIWASLHGFVALEITDIPVFVNRDENFALLMRMLREGFR
jgi:AcrR family transcriptional regulator